MGSSVYIYIYISERISFVLPQQGCLARLLWSKQGNLQLIEAPHTGAAHVQRYRLDGRSLFGFSCRPFVRKVLKR